MASTSTTIPKFYIKKERSNDENSPPKSKFELSKDITKRQSIPTNFFLVESSNNYTGDLMRQQQKRLVDEIKMEQGSSKRYKKEYEKKNQDSTALLKSNEQVIKSNEQLIKSNEALTKSNEALTKSNEALAKELRQATAAISNGMVVLSTIWDQYQKSRKEDIALRQQELAMQHEQDNDDVPQISL